MKSLDNPEPSPLGNEREGATAKGCGYGLRPTPIIPTRTVGPKGKRWPELGGNVEKAGLNGPSITTSLDVTPQDVETSAKWPWAGNYATISISFMEEKRNQGRGRLLNLLNQKIDDATEIGRAHV